jgi:hypothetical protein
MTDAIPLEMYWDEESRVLRPVTPAWAKRAEKQFVGGEVYHITNHEPRSHSSNGHYFAVVGEAWRNLPEHLAERFPTPDHLRKYALIRTGWCNRQEVACGSRAAALALAKVIKSLDTYAVVDIPPGGSVAAILTARSQDRRMGKADFQRSKDDVLGFLASEIGVKPKELQANAGRAA